MPDAVSTLERLYSKERSRPPVDRAGGAGASVLGGAALGRMLVKRIRDIIGDTISNNQAIRRIVGIDRSHATGPDATPPMDSRHLSDTQKFVRIIFVTTNTVLALAKKRSQR